MCDTDGREEVSWNVCLEIHQPRGPAGLHPESDRPGVTGEVAAARPDRVEGRHVVVVQHAAEAKSRL